MNKPKLRYIKYINQDGIKFYACEWHSGRGHKWYSVMTDASINYVMDYLDNHGFIYPDNLYEWVVVKL